MRTSEKKRLRLQGKRRAKLPKPKLRPDKGFSLRTIREADGRFALVKRLRRRLERLVDDAGIDTIQKEMLAGRVVVLAQYCESLETRLLEGKQIDFSEYTQVFNAMSNGLTKLGLDKQFKRDVDTLEGYIAKKAEESKGSR